MTTLIPPSRPITILFPTPPPHPLNQTAYPTTLSLDSLLSDSLISTLNLPSPLTLSHTLTPRPNKPLLSPVSIDPQRAPPFSDRTPSESFNDSTTSGRTIRPRMTNLLASPITNLGFHGRTRQSQENVCSLKHEDEQNPAHQEQIQVGTAVFSPTLCPCRPRVLRFDPLPLDDSSPFSIGPASDVTPSPGSGSGVAGLIVDELDVEWCFHCGRCMPRADVGLRVVRGWGQQWVCRKACQGD